MKSVTEGLVRLMEAASDGKLLANSQMEKIRGTQLAKFELKKGSGYRAYVWKKDATSWVFLLGGKKATQNTDIRDAKWLVASYIDQLGEKL